MKTKLFSDYDENVIQEMNYFIITKDVIDIKMTTVVSVTGKFFNSYLVLYEERG